MVKPLAENASSSFKCSRCGAMFVKQENGATCPVCGQDCNKANCKEVDASDQGY
jgi:rubrerythrin